MTRDASQALRDIVRARNLGCALLHGAGPRPIEETNARRADERVPLPDLFAATELVALTLYDLPRV
jgi:hypothetical protein